MLTTDITCPRRFLMKKKFYFYDVTCKFYIANDFPFEEAELAADNIGLEQMIWQIRS
jgi:hypothetical protein